MENKEVIKFKATLNKKFPQLFPKHNARYEDGDFAILNVDIVEIIEGEVEENKYGNVTVKGNLLYVKDFRTIYTFIVTNIETNEWGTQYTVIMREDVELSNVEQQKTFLQAFLSNNQINSLYTNLKSPLDIIKNKDIETLCSVKGIGKVTAKSIIDKYEENVDYMEAYVELASYGLTTSAIKKLVDTYSSPRILISKIKKNPYILADEVKGIGFNKADKMALANGLSKLSSFRLKAFLTNLLEKGAQDGFSWISSSILVDKVQEDLDSDFSISMISSSVTKLKEEGILLDGKRGIVALNRYYKLEEDIVKELIRIRDAKNSFDFVGWEDRVKEAEQQQGWKYTDEQKSAIQMVMNEQLSIITGGAGCVDCDTEYFNGHEWKRIADYKIGEQVLQYQENGKALLTTPQRYIKLPCETAYHFKNRIGSIDQVLTEEHDFYYEAASNGKPTKKKAKEVVGMHNKSKTGFTGKIPVAFNYSGGNGTGLSEYQIRLMVAVIADGTFDKQGVCRINIKKQRKKDRLENILKILQIPYIKKRGDKKNFNKYYFQAPRREKIYSSFWYNCNRCEMLYIIDEVFHWDGQITDGNKRFFSTQKESADFIQFILASNNIKTSISVDDRVGQLQRNINGKTYKRKSVCYTVTASIQSSKVSLHTKSHRKDNIVKIKLKDGFKYCFTVESGLLVLRRNNRIFITGNCGKTASALGAIKALGDYCFKQCSLSGKAAARMKEATGYESYTIHRLLGVNPNGYDPETKSAFVYNAKNPLNVDAVMLDEFGMVGGKLFLDLLKAIPSGCKLILLGDMGQLPGIGVLNLGADLTYSSQIPTVTLTKIHRQAEKSAIITESWNIRKGKQITEKGWEGLEKRGELQDLELDIYKNNDLTVSKCIKHFKEKLKISGNDIMEVQLITPTTDSGNSSVYSLNNLIQPLYNPPSTDKKEVTLSMGKNKQYILRVGDKVMNMKNNYKTSVVRKTKGFFEDEEWMVVEDSMAKDGIKITSVFNGYMGTIIDIVNDNLIIDFDLVKGIVMVNTGHWRGEKGIQLAYASTCHKQQGSNIKYPICVLDYSHYVMLMKEWVYTAITRASKHCTLIAESKALRYAITETGVEDKQTFLPELLEKYGKLDK